MVLSVEAITAGLAEQLYEDCRTIASLDPDRPVDDELVNMYNQLLDTAHKSFPVYVKMAGLQQMVPATVPYRTALLIVGQLTRLLHLMTYEELPQQPIVQNTPLPIAPQIAPQPAQDFQRGSRSSDGVPIQEYQTRGHNHGNDGGLQPDQDTMYDEELYGASAPTHLNDDGTVRFSLD